MSEHRKPSESLPKILFFNFMIVVILLFLLIVIGELGLRFLIPSIDHSGLVKLTSNPITYEMSPNIRITREGVEISTNPDGFRDADFSGEPQSGQFVIAVLGDSFTFGQGVEQSKTFPVILQNLLNGSQNIGKFRVWNLGVCGYNTAQESYLLKSFVLPRKPDWVVVGYNINDWEPTVDANLVKKEQSSDEPVMKHLKAFIINDLMITQVVKQRLGNLIRIFNPNWYASTYIQDNLDQYLKPDAGWSRVSKLLQDMKADCQSKGVGFTVAILPAMQDFGNYPFEKIDEVTMSFCQKNDIDYVHVLPYFKGQHFMDCWVSAIDSHPNSRAQGIFAKALANHLKMVLDQQHSN